MTLHSWMSMSACALILTTLAPMSAAQERDRLGESQFPRWSPDGSKIAFMSTRDGNYELYTMNADGSGVERLTRHVATDVYPSWSPDGTQIAFASSRQSDFFHGPATQSIFIVDVQSKEVRPLTSVFVDRIDPDDPRGNDTFPFWHPDGSKIAFLSTRSNGVREIFTIKPDGTGLRRITYHNHDHWNPYWSPDGLRILYDAHPEGRPQTPRDQSWSIWSINQHGGDRTRITRDSPGDDYDSALSPDGKRLAFSVAHAQRKLGRGLFFSNADGSNRTSQALSEEDQFYPAWSPDGSKIAFVSTRDGQREIYVMKSDGNDVKRLTFSQREEDE